MNAAELAALADRLAEHAPPGTPERDFARAVARWLQGEEDTLDAALGLSAHRGQDSAPRRWRRDQRNRHLTTALELVEGDTTGARCRAARRRDRPVRVENLAALASADRAAARSQSATHRPLQSSQIWVPADHTRAAAQHRARNRFVVLISPPRGENVTVGEGGLDLRAAAAPRRPQGHPSPRGPLSYVQLLHALPRRHPPRNRGVASRTRRTR
ncbi:MAG: hypothetical protein MZV65_27320 [Chromatiales bacterium]|nr:hypothetical protein [Chromatiales bacterium]